VFWRVLFPFFFFFFFFFFEAENYAFLEYNKKI